MKNLKVCLVSLAMLIPAAQMSAMQIEQKQAKSGYAMPADLIAKIEAEVNAIAIDIVNTIKKVQLGQGKAINTLNLEQRLDHLILALPLPLNDLKHSLIKFLSRAKFFDRASAQTPVNQIVELAKRVNEVGKEIKVQLQKASQIDEISEKLGVKKPAPAVSSSAVLLKDLAQALHTDVEKIVNFDVRSQKVPGSLTLTENLIPFASRLNGELSELRKPLETYINLARAFDNAHDTELMELVSQAVENLSERIAYLRGLAEVKPHLNAVAQEPAPKSILVKEDAQRKQKRNISFAPDTKPAQENGAVQRTTITKPFILNAKELDALARNIPASLSSSVVEKSATRATGTKNAVIVTSIMAAPLVVAGLAAAYDAGYLTPAIDAVVPRLSNAAQNIAGQMVATGNSIGRSLGNLGTTNISGIRNAFLNPAFSFLAPYQNAMLVSAGVVGAYNVRKLLNRSAQSTPVQQAPAPRSSVVVEELDEKNNVVAVLPKVTNRKPVITRNRVFAAAGLAGVAGLGYTAWNYFAPSTTPDMTQAITPQITQVVTAPIASVSTNVGNVVSGINVPRVATMVGQDVYHWLANQAINPFQ